MSVRVDSVTIKIDKEIELALLHAGIKISSIEFTYGKDNQARRTIIYKLTKDVKSGLLSDVYSNFQSGIERASEELASRNPKKYKDAEKTKKTLMGRLVGEYVK